jgi:spore coat polysaccharide biosynthesis protein SpsF
METNDPRYLEHVTNYIYENENVFKIKKIDIPKYLKNNKNLRFTVDDLLDFEIMSKIYQELGENTQSINLLSDLVKNNNYIKKNMKLNIKNYSK